MRTVRCQHPDGCIEDSVTTTLRCVAHMKAGDLKAYAEEYAVASIIYYSGLECGEFMSDARFDGLCQTLLERKAYKTIPWIDRESLIAGTGYDTKVFPEHLHEVAREWAESPAR
jgi:hypothetical protein